MTFGVESAVQGNIGHLVLRGEFDIATAPAVSTAGLKLLDSPGVKTLMIDMAAVTFVGSTGLVPSSKCGIIPAPTSMSCYTTSRPLR